MPKCLYLDVWYYYVSKARKKKGKNKEENMMKNINLNIRSMMHSFGIGAILATMMLNISVAAAPTSKEDIAPPTAIVSIFGIDF